MKSDVRTTFCPNFDFTVKTLMISNSLYHRNFQMKTDRKVKICFYAKICTRNKILASKMRNLKQQKTSVFAPLILIGWILSDWCSLGISIATHDFFYKKLFYKKLVPRWPKFEETLVLFL